MDTLEEAGLEFVEAEDAGQALAVLERRPEIAVLFTDINVPGALDDFALARRVHERRPDTQIILTSGKFSLQGPEMPADNQYIPKPCAPELVTCQVTAAPG